MSAEGDSNLMTAQPPTPAYAQSGGPEQGGSSGGMEMIQNLQKAIISMEERGMQHDPRYNQLLGMRAKQQGGYLGSAPGPQGDGSTPDSNQYSMNQPPHGNYGGHLGGMGSQMGGTATSGGMNNQMGGMNSQMPTGSSQIGPMGNQMAGGPSQVGPMGSQMQGVPGQMGTMGPGQMGSMGSQIAGAPGQMGSMGNQVPGRPGPMGVMGSQMGSGPMGGHAQTSMAQTMTGPNVTPPSMDSQKMMGQPVSSQPMVNPSVGGSHVSGQQPGSGGVPLGQGSMGAGSTMAPVPQGTMPPPAMGQQPMMGNNPGQMRSSPFSASQLHQLRAQIMAYKMLARNQPVSESVRLALEGKRPMTPQMRHPAMPGMRMHTPPMGGSQQQPGMPQSSQVQAGAQSGMPSPAPSQGYPDQGQASLAQPTSQQPLPADRKPATGPPTSGQPAQPQATAGIARPSDQTPSHPPSMQAMMTMQQKQNRLAPVAKPQGLDPITLLQERENRVAARIQSRIIELSKLPAVMPEDNFVKAQIELRALRLLNFQRSLRKEVVSCMRRDTTLETALNSITIIVNSIRPPSCLLQTMHSHWRDCKAWRDEHLPLSTTSDEACKLYDATLTQYTGWYDDASVGGIEASIKGMITSDPNFAMGHVLGVGLELMGTGHSPRLDPVFKAEIDQLGTLASSTNLTQREQLHVKAIQLLGEGMMTEACDAWEKILLQHPTDMLAIKFCQDAYFYLGYQPQMRDSVARVLPSWKSSQPLYGYLMGMHAFGLCETNMYSQAEKSARKGLEMNPRDTWSTHALAHILEMEGRYNEGITFLSSTVNNWSESGGLTFHNLWHWAVYHIEKGQYQAALDIFDGELAPATKKGSMITLVDTTSLLYRLEMEGENVGERWQGLYEVCRKHQSDHLQPFYDSHMLLAYLGAEHTETATNMLESMKQLVREQPGTRYGSTHEVSISLCEALVAYDQGEFNKAVKLLYPQRYKIVTLGGSTAQRDIFNQFLIHAALKSNNTENIKLARHLLAERKALKTDAPLTDRLITQCIAIHID